MPIGVMLRMTCGRFSAVETWYSRTFTVVNDAVTPGELLAVRRAEVLARNGYVEGYRVFNTDVKYDVRNVSLANFLGDGGPGLTGGGGGPNPDSFADIQQTSLLGKVRGSVGGRVRNGNRELFGVPDDIVQTTAQGERVYTPTAHFLKGFLDYRKEITGNWSFRVLTITPRHNIIHLVVDAAPPGLLGLQVDLAGDALIAPGKRVRIRGAIKRTTMLTLNGLWTVSRVDPPVAPSTLSTVYLIGSSSYAPTGYDPLGTVEGIAYSYCPALDYDIQRPMGRKRGGRSGLARGRSLARSR